MKRASCDGGIALLLQAAAGAQCESDEGDVGGSKQTAGGERRVRFRASDIAAHDAREHGAAALGERRGHLGSSDYSHTATPSQIALLAPPVRMPAIHVDGARSENEGTLLPRIVLPPVQLAPIVLSSSAHADRAAAPTPTVHAEKLPSLLRDPAIAPIILQPSPQTTTTGEAPDPATVMLLQHNERLLREQQSNIAQLQHVMKALAGARVNFDRSAHEPDASLHHVALKLERMKMMHQYILEMQSRQAELCAQQEVIRAQLAHTRNVINAIALRQANARFTV
jgi:hypothetical protein